MHPDELYQPHTQTNINIFNFSNSTVFLNRIKIELSK